MKYRILWRKADKKWIKGPFVHDLEYVEKLIIRMQKMCDKGKYDYASEESYNEQELYSGGSVEQKLLNIRELKLRGIYEASTNDNRCNSPSA